MTTTPSTAVAIIQPTGDFILPILAVVSGDRALVVVLRSWLDDASGC